MKRLFWVLLLPLLLGSWQTSNRWQDKIDSRLLEQVQQTGLAECIVVLQPQADVSLAKEMRTKAEKGQYVFEQLQLLAEQTQPTVIQTIQEHEAPFRSFYLVNAVWTMGDLDLLQSLAALDIVEKIVNNPQVTIAQPVRPTAQAAIRTVEWGITNINADDVWAMGYSGQNVIIAGQDTGYEWDHDALKESYKGWNGATADHNYNWHDAIHSAGASNPCGSDSAVPCDDHNHGTHTMGTMTGDDGGANEIGVAPSAKWIGCRNMDQGNGTPATYIECFEWFLAPTDLNDQNPDPAQAPHVINNSWGCPPSEGCNTGNFSMMETAVNNLRNAGIVVVVSAGNSGSNCETIDDPSAIFDGSFTVGATDSSDNIAGFSSRGPVTVDGSGLMKPNVSAPGVGVRSAIRNNGYATFNGTSMAGPHVAGAVALIISANPALAGDVATIENILEGTAVARTTTQVCGGVAGTNIPNNTYGFGKIDALAAVNEALTLLPITLSEFYGSSENNFIHLYWNVEKANDFSHFEIEKRIANTWQNIGQVAAHSPTIQHHNFTFSDNSPNHGINYYRLKMIDQDNTFSYSTIAAIPFHSTPRITLSPNPIDNYVLLSGDNWTAGQLTFQIFDITGQLVAQEKKQVLDGSNTIYLSTAFLNDGIYFINVQTPFQSSIHKEKIIKLSK